MPESLDALISHVQQQQVKTDRPVISIGDTIDVHTRIVEGSKERIQVFRGVAIAMQGEGLEATVTVRRIVANEGVERVFPLHSPRVAKIEIVRHGHARRSKLYYLRDRVGKARRLADRRKTLDTDKARQVRKTPKAKQTGVAVPGEEQGGAASAAAAEAASPEAEAEAARE
jgi:large subunit ribosomal protein L19